MKIEVTETKLFMSVKGVEQPVPVGTILEVDRIPGHMVGKCRVVGDTGDKTLLIGDDIEALRARYKELTGNKAQANMKPETLRAKIEEAEAAKTAEDLDNLRTEFLELTGELPAETLGIDELKSAIADLSAKS